MRKKILFALIGIITGVLIFINFETLDPFYVLIASTILFFFFYFFENKYITFPIFLALGFVLSLYNFNQYSFKDEEKSKVLVTITEKRALDESYRYFAIVRGEGIDEKSVFISDDDYQIGEVLLVRANPDLPNKNTNPNLFNYRNYLISKKIASTFEVEEVYKKSISGSRLLTIRRRFYNYIHKLFENNLSAESSEFAISIVLAENLIDNDGIKDLGLAHILAVSGLHIDLLVGFILFIFSKFNLNYKYGYITALLICLLYGYIISFPFSVIRVLIINFIGFLAFLYRQPEDKIKSLMIAALFILILNPFALLNAGFVLSFAATAAVFLIWPRFKMYLSDNLVYENLGFTTAIQLGLLPFSVYYYGKLNLLAIVANFIIVPIFTLAMYLIFACIFLYPMLRVLTKPIFILLDYLLSSVLNITSLLSHIDFLSFDFAHPSILVTLYLFVLILLVFNIKRSNKRLIRYFYTTNMLIVALSLGYDILNPEVSFSMIDIGQGDAFLLNDGGDYYLFDVGGPKYDNYDSGQRILIPHLKSLGIKDIEGIFISHEDLDHSGNLPMLYENFNVKNLITNKYNTEGLKDYNPRIIHKGDQIPIKNGQITCVYEGEKGEENAESLGLIIEIDGVKILTLGDLDSIYEDKLDIKADILKVSHHGSKKSTSRAFVEKVKPKVALISAGRNNRYGHPSKEVIENLDGVKIYSSQDRGMVKIVFDKNIRIESYLQGGYFR